MAPSGIDDRIKAGGLALVLQALLVWALIVGLRVDLPGVVADALKVFAVGPPPPRPVVKTMPERRRSHRPAGTAAPPAPQAKATALVAPPPVIPLPPPPVVAASDPGSGTAPAPGNADRPGAGTGTGGLGEGTGSGGRGTGDGGDRWTPPRLVDDIRRGDYPPAAAEAEAEGVVTIRYRVGIDGRVTDCRLVRGSGSVVLDSATCPLAERRFRYRPARDADGRPIVTMVTREQEWIIDSRHPADRSR